MKQIFKILSLPVIGFIAFFSFSLGGVPLIEGYHPLDPLIDTYHSKSYTIKKFDQVKIGDTKETLLSFLGDPLFIREDTLSQTLTLYFTGDGRLTKYENYRHLIQDFAWYRSSVKLDKNNKVVEIDKGWSHD